MATEKEFEGQVWIPKVEVEGIVRDRVGRVAEKANEWEGKAREWENRWKEAEPRITTADTLSARVQELEGKLQSAEGRYSRFSAAAASGITDGDTIEMLEFAHSKAMANQPKKDQVEFTAWLGQIKGDPSLAPAPLRHLFQVQEQAPQGQPPTGQQAPQGQPQGQGRPAWAPATAGLQQPPQAPGGLDVTTIRQADSMEKVRALIAQRRNEKAGR